MLKVSNLNAYYGVIHAIKGISFRVPEGKIVTLIGSNGAGKSSTLKSIEGMVTAKGSIKFLGKEIIGSKTHTVSKMGIAMVPEGRKVFANLTILENLRMGAFNKNAAEIEDGYKESFELFPILKERSNQLAGTLSGGEQQMLALGRALMSRPALLMLDEPSLGLAPIIVSEVFNIIQMLNKKGMTILLVEQNASVALKISDYGYVLENGRIILEDEASNLITNEQVRKCYLGEE